MDLRPGGDFTLQSPDGPISLTDLNGKVVLLFFGYTSCADVCPITLSAMSKVFSKLSAEELEQVQALFVSLDPERDTPELLAKYTGYFHPNIIGATGSMAVLRQVMEDYGIRYERKDKPGSALGYVIYHTPDILVVDGQGRLLEERIALNTSTEDIAAYVKRLINGSL